MQLENMIEIQSVKIEDAVKKLKIMQFITRWIQLKINRVG